MMKPELKVKDFWERPEGTTGMVFVVAGLLLGGYVLYHVLPYLIVLLQNALYATLLGAALFGLFAVLMNERFQLLVSYGFKSLMRMLTGVLIEIDPIGILKSYIADLKNSHRKMTTQIDRLRGEMKALANSISKNRDDLEQSLKVAKQAQKAGQQAQVRLKARRAGRLQDSNRTLEDLYQKMELLMRVLMKMREVTEVIIEDTEHEVYVKEREYRAIKAGHSAIRQAKAILQGERGRKELFEETMDHINLKLAMQMGEIESFMEMSESFIGSIDLQNAIYEEEALKMLESWEQKSDELLLLGEGTKAQLVLESKNPSSELDLEAIPVSHRFHDGDEEPKKYFTRFFEDDSQG